MAPGGSGRGLKNFAALGVVLPLSQKSGYACVDMMDFVEPIQWWKHHVFRAEESDEIRA